MQFNEDAARATLQAAGLKGKALEDALVGLANARVSAGIQVVVNPPAERKFGDLSVYKVKANGFRQPVVGLSKEQATDLVAQLQAAIATI